MLTFSTAQVDRLTELRMEIFVAEMVDYVRARHSEIATVPKSVLLKMLRTQIEEARAAEFRLPSHMRRYLDLSIVLGTDFAREEWAAAIMSNSNLVPAARLHKLEHEAMFRVKSQSIARRMAQMSHE